MHEPVRSMRYHVVHTTSYRYSDPVALCHNEVHLSPRNTPCQTRIASDLTILPSLPKVDEVFDYFGNHVSYFSIQEQHQQFSVTARSDVRMMPSIQVSPQGTPAWELARDGTDEPTGDLELESQFIYDSPLVIVSAALADYARLSFAPGRPWLEAVLELMARIHQDFVYDPTATNVSTSLDTVMQTRRGVCQDFAHFQIGCLRALGLPARYVSGYLLTTPPPGQPRLIGADASHAWLSAFCPTVGWVDLDPTNNVVASLHHITVAWGRDYSDVCPIKGVFVGGGEHSMQVSVDVRPVDNGSTL